MGQAKQSCFFLVLRTAQLPDVSIFRSGPVSLCKFCIGAPDQAGSAWGVRAVPLTKPPTFTSMTRLLTLCVFRQQADSTCTPWTRTRGGERPEDSYKGVQFHQLPTGTPSPRHRTCTRAYGQQMLMGGTSERPCCLISTFYGCSETEVQSEEMTCPKVKRYQDHNLTTGNHWQLK